MKVFVKDYLSFNKRERSGLVILLLLLITVVAAPYFVPLFITKENADFSKFKNEIEAFERSLITETEVEQKFDYNDIDKSMAENVLHPFPFDPNGLAEEDWRAMGMSEKKIRIIKNFEAKGGKFRKKEDLKKIYGITQSEYEVLEPYIVIATTESKNYTETKETFSKKNSAAVEINAADTTTLKTLKGIGSGYAKKIIAYRKKLGGYLRMEQLLEVYGMDSLRYSLFSHFILIDESLVKKININTATFDELKAHPYIGYNLAIALVNMRKSQGGFKAVSDIKKSVLVTEKIFNKLSPYLTVN